jgi:hypothetical protein
MTICDRLLLCGSRLCTSSNNATPLVYLVRLSTISTTFVTKVMGSTGDVESGLRAALASAPLTDAALGDVITNVLSIITDAIEPGGLMGMTISSSHTSLQATTNGAVKAIFELTTPKRAETSGEYDGMPLPLVLRPAKPPVQHCLLRRPAQIPPWSSSPLRTLLHSPAWTRARARSAGPL